MKSQFKFIGEQIEQKSVFVDGGTQHEKISLVVFQL